MIIAYYLESLYQLHHHPLLFVDSNDQWYPKIKQIKTNMLLFSLSMLCESSKALHAEDNIISVFVINYLHEVVDQGSRQCT